MPSITVKAKSDKRSLESVGRGFSFYQKLFFLYFLNVSDWICTEALIGSGYFYEVNPIMQPILNGFWSTVIVKGVLPLALILFCCLIFKLAGEAEGRIINYLLYSVAAVYVVVNLWHIINFVLLFLRF